MDDEDSPLTQALTSLCEEYAAADNCDRRAKIDSSISDEVLNHFGHWEGERYVLDG